LFSTVAGESLADGRLLSDPGLAARSAGTLYSRLVLTFAQADVRLFAPRHWTVLEEMRALGFRFALDEVTDLDFDFEALRAAGFAFAKLDAPVFLEGLPAPAGHIPSADVCRHLANFGLALIVGRIDDERQLGRILGFGVLFGQGSLFGAPRPVKSDIVGGRRESAA
ncbi:MAG: EAL domain-containing protein, partial [Hyphomicrobiaceae bacterium]